MCWRVRHHRVSTANRRSPGCAGNAVWRCMRLLAPSSRPSGGFRADAVVVGSARVGSQAAAILYRAGRTWRRCGAPPEPGSAGETHSGYPLGAINRLDVAAVSVCLARVLQVDDLALDAGGRIAQMLPSVRFFGRAQLRRDV